MAYERYEAMLPGLHMAPGFRPMIVLTPEHYSRMQFAQGSSQWPALFFGPKIANMVQNFLQAVLQRGYIDNLKAHIYPMLEAGFDIAREQAVAGPTGDSDALWRDIMRLTEGLYDNWKAGIGVGMGAAFSSAMDDFLQTGQLTYAYKTLAYHTAITPRMRRHWNKMFTPMIPDAQMAWMLHRRGKFTRGQFDEHAAWDGWDKAGTDLLAEVMTSLPSPGEAFYLWCKGQLTEIQRNTYYFAGGWDPAWHAMLTENYYYTPTIYDLTRIADYVELDQIWALDVMKRRGLKESDRAKVWEMLVIRPIRDEIRNKTTHAIYCRRYGYWSKTKFEAFLADMAAKKYIRPKEMELLKQYGQDLYEQELKIEWVEILRWRFRTAQISDTEFLDGLTDPKGPVAMVWEKANLIVEGEKAKGYYGYY